MMRFLRPRTPSGRAALVVVVVALAAAFAACTLNPQPLPPGDDSDNGQATGGAYDAGRGTDAGGFGSENPAPAADGGATADGDAGLGDGGDAGDAGGDAGDAGDGGTDGG